jgi:hypothetical protein
MELGIAPHISMASMGDVMLANNGSSGKDSEYLCMFHRFVVATVAATNYRQPA